MATRKKSTNTRNKAGQFTKPPTRKTRNIGAKKKK